MSLTVPPPAKKGRHIKFDSSEDEASEPVITLPKAESGSDSDATVAYVEPPTRETVPAQASPGPAVTAGTDVPEETPEQQDAASSPGAASGPPLVAVDEGLNYSFGSASGFPELGLADDWEEPRQASTPETVVDPEPQVPQASAPESTDGEGLEPLPTPQPRVAAPGLPGLRIGDWWRTPERPLYDPRLRFAGLMSRTTDGPAARELRRVYDPQCVPRVLFEDLTMAVMRREEAVMPDGTRHVIAETWLPRRADSQREKAVQTEDD